MSDLALYNYFRSSASYRVRIALHWKELQFDYRPVHLLENGGQQHSPAYKALNPASEVPTLVHQGQVLSQSMAILHYLDETFPTKLLFPRSPFLKAKVLQFCEGINCTQPLQNLKVLQYLENSLKITAEQKSEWLQRWIGGNLGNCEKMIEPTAGTYCFGDEITAADVFLMPQLFTSKRFNIDLSKYPTLLRVQENCDQLEAFQKAHPFHQIDTPTELRT